MSRTYRDDELVYAATSRCACGAGYAYPADAGPHGAWDCAAILRGTADPAVTHSAVLPFTFWEVKSERQPSAYGATTRPRADDQPPRSAA